MGMVHQLQVFRKSANWIRLGGGKQEGREAVNRGEESVSGGAAP